MATQEERLNVTLLVSNQSFDVNPVDLVISIDGQVVVRDEFDIEGEQPPQHNWRQFQLSLDDGPHSLHVRSKKGRATLHETFEVNGLETLMVAYWNQRSGKSRRSKGFFTVEHGSEHESRPAATM